jgi:hypothetical protein
MDFLKPGKRRDVDLIGGNANNRAIYPMQLMNEIYTIASKACDLQR